MACKCGCGGVQFHQHLRLGKCDGQHQCGCHFTPILTVAVVDYIVAVGYSTAQHICGRLQHSTFGHATLDLCSRGLHKLVSRPPVKVVSEAALAII